MSRRKREFKRVVAVSDLHCGSIVGLTPPGQWPHLEAVRAVQRELWGWFEREVRALGFVDAVLCLGDAIDGKGQRQGGIEQYTTDMIEQAAIAAQCLRAIDNGSCEVVMRPMRSMTGVVYQRPAYRFKGVE